MKSGILRLALSSFIVLSVTLLVSCEPENNKPSGAIDAIPLRSSIIIRVNDGEALQMGLSQSDIYNELSELYGVQDFESWLISIPKAFRKQTYWVAMHPSGAKEHELLFIAEMPEPTSLPDSIEWSTKEYAGTPIYSTSREHDEWHISSHKGLLLISPSVRLVEEAIRQLNTEHTLAEDHGFSRAVETSNPKDPLNLFLHFEELEEAVTFMLPSAPAGFIPHMGTWAAYDMAVHREELLLNGVVFNSDSSNSWLSCFKNSRAGAFESEEILSSNTAQAILIHTGNFSE